MNYEIFSYILRVKEQFLVAYKSRSSFLRTKIMKEYLCTPYDRTVCCTFRITEQFIVPSE